MLEKIRKFILCEKKIAEIKIGQHFPIYGAKPEIYTIIFMENIFERYIEIMGSNFTMDMRVWMGTEIYIFTISPWKDRILSNRELLLHLDIIRNNFGNPVKNKDLIKDNNVIELSRYLSRRSIADRNGV